MKFDHGEKATNITFTQGPGKHNTMRNTGNMQLILDFELVKFHIQI